MCLNLMLLRQATTIQGSFKSKKPFSARNSVAKSNGGDQTKSLPKS